MLKGKACRGVEGAKFYTLGERKDADVIPGIGGARSLGGGWPSEDLGRFYPLRFSWEKRNKKTCPGKEIPRESCILKKFNARSGGSEKETDESSGAQSVRLPITNHLILVETEEKTLKQTLHRNLVNVLLGLRLSNEKRSTRTPLEKKWEGSYPSIASDDPNL